MVEAYGAGAWSRVAGAGTIAASRILLLSAPVQGPALAPSGDAVAADRADRGVRPASLTDLTHTEGWTPRTGVHPSASAAPGPFLGVFGRASAPPLTSSLAGPRTLPFDQPRHRYLHRPGRTAVQ